LLHLATAAVEGQGAAQKAPAVRVSSAAPKVPIYNPYLPPPRPAPRNADGHADLNGMWEYRTGTPVQRAPEFGDKLFLKPDEAAALHKKIKEGFDPNKRSANPEVDAYNLGMNAEWFDYGGQLAQNRTSLVVDPPNGRIPDFTQAAKDAFVKCSGIAYCGPLMMGQRGKVLTDERKADHITDRSVTERCLNVRAGPPIEATAWNNNLRIVHAKDAVILETEMIHTARPVWLDGRPRPDPAVKLWHGYSRGRWEGDTLVVETTNFKSEARWLGVMNPETFTLVERFTRIDADTMLYEYTMNDPETWTAPWTMQNPMRKLDGMMYEYACHEGNYGVKFQLSAARGLEKQSAKPAGGK
jgi:hypothetical protein